jgi:hypothetical protein
MAVQICCFKDAKETGSPEQDASTRHSTMEKQRPLCLIITNITVFLYLYLMKRFFFTCKTLVFLVCFTGCYSEKILIITDIGLAVDDALAIHMIFTHEPSSVLAIACTGSHQPAGMVNELKCPIPFSSGIFLNQENPCGSGSVL